MLLSTKRPERRAIVLLGRRLPFSMTTPTDPLRSETTYFIDAENAAEMARLTNQDRLITRMMGGLFPVHLDPVHNIHDILDISCGPGGWVLDIAQAYPEKWVTGI